MRAAKPAIVLSLSLAACGGRPASANVRTATAELRLLHASCSNDRIDFMAGADQLEVSVSGGDQQDRSLVGQADPMVVTVPLGAAREVTVLAQQGNVMRAWGHATVRFDAPGQQFSVPVVMYPYHQFAPLADTQGECVNLVPRAGFAASLMRDGRVLLAGGFTGAASPTTLTGRDLVASAQLLDPRSGELISVPDACDPGGSCEPRMRDTAVTLDDGRVLVAGGRTLRPGAGAPEDAVPPVLYDPVASTWTAAPMKVPRRGFTPVLMLPDHREPSKVEAIGGLPGSDGPDPGTLQDTPVASVEIFDPVTSSWSVLTDGIQAAGKQVLLSDYRVGPLGGGIDAQGRSLGLGFVLVGGRGPPGSAGEPGPLSPTAYAFRRDDLPVPIGSFDMTVATSDLLTVGLGHLLLILSGAPGEADATTYLWNGIADVQTGTLPAIAGGCAVVLDENDSLIIGGNGSTYFASLDDRGAMTLGSVPIPGSTASARPLQIRTDQACLRVSDHQVLILGGYGLSGEARTLGSAEVFTF